MTLDKIAYYFSFYHFRILLMLFLYKNYIEVKYCCVSLKIDMFWS